MAQRRSVLSCGGRLRSVECVPVGACFRIAFVGMAVVGTAFGSTATPRALRTGWAGHAFDHLGGIHEQAETAAACGANIIYATGVGALGYCGLPPAKDLLRANAACAEYFKRARRHGIERILGYVCATSLVKLDQFDKNWSETFRAQFHTPPAQWRQQDRFGRPLASWYGGDYQPACMNHPDWRAYERYVVRQQLESGCDGVFFDNPTVHPQGCYCRYCMARFLEFLRQEGGQSFQPSAASPSQPEGGEVSLESARALALTRSNDFKRFRCTIAREFLADMRRFARSLRPGALITANNSLNSPDALYSQCHTYAYNPYELSKVEDFVVVEDMSSQPRTLPNGQMREYGPTYRQLHAICHNKPIVAVTLADGDYHTPPHLVRLAMAEAIAHDASYLLWPTWPEKERARMIAAIRPQVDLFRRYESFLSGTRPRRDAVLFLPFRRWLETTKCAVSELAAALTRANVQYEVISEDDLRAGSESAASAKSLRAVGDATVPRGLKDTKILIAESRSVFTPEELRIVETFLADGGVLVTAENKDWLRHVQALIAEPPVLAKGPPTVRCVIRDHPKATIVHLYNLNVERLSSFEDRVIPATDLQIVCRVPFGKIRSVRAITGDEDASMREVRFACFSGGRQSVVEVSVPKLAVAAMLIIQP